MRLPLVVLLASVALLGATGVAVAADGQNAPPPWPGNDTDPENNTTSVPPGQQLAGAVGAQVASVEGELWNRTLADRLDNATTPAERATVIADETETIEEYVEALEGIRRNVSDARAADRMDEGRYRAALSALVVRARTVELRANRTARVAENVSVIVRDSHGVNATRVWNLSARAHALYQFEGDVGREVANETLRTESALAGMTVGGDEPPRRNSTDVDRTTPNRTTANRTSSGRQ